MSAPGTDAWHLIAELFFNGEVHRRMHEACDATGLHPGLLKSLASLDGEVGTPMRDLAERFVCDASYITGIADDLEQRGLAERRPHPTDRRIKTLLLTPVGVEMRDRALAVLYEPPASMGALTAAEQRTLRDLLQKIVDADLVLAERRTLFNPPAAHATEASSGRSPGRSSGPATKRTAR